MTHRPDRKGILHSLPRGLRLALAVLVAVAALVAGVCGYDYITINLWIDRDAGRLENYPVQLIENQQEVTRWPSSPLAQLDRLLIEEMRRGRRNVVTLSRSDIKYNLLRTSAYVKVFLETAAPEQPQLRSPLRLICHLRRGSHGWVLAEPPFEKTIK